MENNEDLNNFIYDDRLNFCDNYIDSVRRMNDKLSDIQEIRDSALWELKSISRKPDGTPELLSEEDSDNYTKHTALIKERYPIPVLINEQCYGGTVPITTSGSSTLAGKISYCRWNDNPEVQEWAIIRMVEYGAIQEKHHRVEKVKEYLRKLNPCLVMELEKAEKEKKSAVDGIASKFSAATLMRILLDHYKGYLFKKAQKWPKENKLKWTSMADRLVLRGVGSAEHTTILEQEDKLGVLKSDLSQIVHGNDQGILINLDDLWGRIIDHLFTVLSLVRLK